MRIHVRPAIAAIAVLSIASAIVTHGSAAFAGAGEALATVDHSGGGHILRASLGTQPSLKAATIALLTRIHSLLGSRPTIVRIMRNEAEHTVAVVFTGSQSGRPISGMSIVTAAPGIPASGAVVYDTTANFPRTAGRLLHDLGATAPARGGGGGGEALAMAPAEPLIAHAFPDNTGSIGLPEDWTLKASGGGSAWAEGPSAELIYYQQPAGFVDPSGTWAKILTHGTNIYADPARRAQDLKTTKFLAYTGDAVQAWKTLNPKWSVDDRHKIGDRVEFVGGHANISSGAYAPGQVTYFAYVTVLPMDNLGKYSVVWSICIVPKKAVAAQAATAAAVFNSVRINEAQINANLGAFDKMMQDRYNQRFANIEIRNEQRAIGTQHSIANADSNSNARQVQGAAMTYFAGDRSVVVNTETGQHEHIANSALPPNYQVVPLQDYIRGVDY